MLKTPPPLPTRSRFPWPAKVAIAIGTLPILALVLFHPVENWRGKRAWEKCRRELAAKGEVLDWDAYIPPPVPDEQNVFKVPQMAEWFVGRGTNELVRRLDPENLLKFCSRFHTNVVIDLSVVACDKKTDHQDADLVLRYDPPILTRESLDALPTAASTRIPLIRFENVPLRIAVQNLARQAELNYILDPKLDFDSPDNPEPNITRQWQDVTAMQAMFDVLNDYNLQWIENSKTSVALVTAKKSESLRLVYASDDLRAQINHLIQKAILPALTNRAQKPGAKGAQSLELVLNSERSTTPARVILKAGKLPGLKEVAEFFPTNVVLSGCETMGLRVEADGIRFQVLLGPPPFTASEYLAWSDQFLPEFDIMREALKRPYARMDGDYQQPSAGPIPNIMTFRRVTETLTQRTQCFLLLGQPDKAMHELTLLHKLSRSLECRPTTVVAVMLQTAISDLYVKTVSEGMRQQVWRETDLAEIQGQLKQINLLPLLVDAFRLERASFPQTMEIELAARLKRSWGLRLYPRGWLYQNYVSNLAMHQEMIGCLDVTNRIVLPRETDRFSHRIANHKVFWPYELFAYLAMPNFSKAIESVAFHQTQMDEALIACALERHRLATGQYPETLEVLTPSFLDEVPADIVSGRPLKYRCEASARFVLYSKGWNGTDECGTARLDRNGTVQTSKGDWVWLPSTK